MPVYKKALKQMVRICSANGEKILFQSSAYKNPPDGGLTDQVLLHTFIIKKNNRIQKDERSLKNICKIL